jgi:hypothetical protein
MEFLNKLVRYFVRQLVALGLMAVAPAIYLVIPFLVLSTSSKGDLHDLAGVYLLTGPFVSAFSPCEQHASTLVAPAHGEIMADRSSELFDESIRAWVKVP